MSEAALTPLRGGPLVTATVGIAVLTAMTVLDSTIANMALSTIAGNLGVAVSQGTWVITFFGVANAVAIPLTGWLARRMGEVRLYFVASALFVLSSFLCGISSSLGMLIFFRLLQGVAAGPCPSGPWWCWPPFRPHFRRLDLRQLPLGLDFFRQRAGGRSGPVVAARAAALTGNPHRQSAH